MSAPSPNLEASRRRASVMPAAARARLLASLADGEGVVAILRVDLDEELRYAERYGVLTSERFLVIGGGGDARRIAEHGLAAIASMTSHDRGGLGALEILADDRRLARLPYTVGCAPAARALVEAFDALRSLPADARRASSELSSIADPSTESDEGASGADAANEEAPARVASLARLFGFARRRMGAVAIGALLTLASTGAGLIPPYLVWPLVDEILEPYQARVDAARRGPDAIDGAPRDATKDVTDPQVAARLAEVRASGARSFSRVPWFLLGMAAAALLAWALSWAQGWALAWVSERISADVRNATYAHLHRLSLDFFGARRTGDLVARISSDTDRICGFLSDTLMDFVTDVLMILGTAGVLFWMNPLLGLAALVTFPPIAFLTLRLRDRLSHGFVHGGRAWSDMTSILADTIPGIRVVKAFAQEGREVERFRAANDRIMAINDRINRVWTFFWPMVALFNQVGLLVVWAVGAHQIHDQRVTVGMLTASLAYIARFYTRLESMSRVAGLTQRAAASAQRIFEILDRAPAVPEPERPLDPGRVRGEIALRGVSFRYGNRQILDDIDLHIAPGEMIGVVGETGAGKTTLANLICRFHDVSAGAILVDGIDLRAFSIEAYRRNIGLVLQDPFLFYGTIADNIAYGRPSATRAEIVAAARAARAATSGRHRPASSDRVHRGAARVMGQE